MDYNNGDYNLPNNNSGYDDQIYHGNGGVSITLHPVGIKDNIEAVLGLKLNMDEELKKCFIPPTDNKAIKFNALSLRIGKWKFKPVRHSDLLICRGYFINKYFAWEIFDGTLTKKIQFDFSSIGHITYNFSLNTVTLELKDSPSFSVELPPKRKKHTKWKTCHDFTDNQASSLLHSHVLELKPTVLENNWKYFMMAHRPTVSYSLFYNVPRDNNADNQNEAMLRQIDDPLPEPALETFTNGVGCPPINGYVQKDGANHINSLDDQTIDQTIGQFNFPYAPSLIDNPQPPSSFAENCYESDDINQNDAMCNHYVPNDTRHNPQPPPSSFAENCYNINQNDAMYNHYVPSDPPPLPLYSVDEASSSGVGCSQGNGGYLLNHVEDTNGYYSQPSYQYFVNWDNN